MGWIGITQIFAKMGRNMSIVTVKVIQCNKNIVVIQSIGETSLERCVQFSVKEMKN